MPTGGPLQLKGGTPWLVKKKKKKKKDKQAQAGDREDKPEALIGTDGKPIDPTSISVLSGNTYERDFAFEQERVKKGKTKNVPWGSSYRAPPEILHGYSAVVTGKTAEERLDLRAASKADKFCK